MKNLKQLLMKNKYEKIKESIKMMKISDEKIELSENSANIRDNNENS